MRDEVHVFTYPKWRATRWLADAGPDVPEAIRDRLIASLFGTLPIFLGGVLNTIVVSGVIALRLPTTAFIAWFVVEAALGVIRLAVLGIAIRRARKGLSTPTDLYLALALCWAASVGYGAFVSMLSGDWVAATLACLSSGAMVGGICFRNFGAPRHAAIMILLSLGPIPVAALFCGEPLMLVAALQIPAYFLSMRRAAFKLNGLLVATMRAERENEHKARHDVLTGLANRAGLMRAIDGRSRDVAPRALLYLDLDGFKAINDTYGHAVGDQLLTQAAQRLKDLLRGDDVAARIGGDEFVVIAHGVQGPGHAAALGERLIKEVSAPYALGEVRAQVGVSVGVALVPEHGDSITELLDRADAALYQAKLSGKSRCVVADLPVAAPHEGAGLPQPLQA